MSLEARIRVIAREEAGAAGSSAAVESLAQQLADLHVHMHVLASRVARAEEEVTALKGAAAAVEASSDTGPVDAAQPPAMKATGRRGSRRLEA